MKVTGVLHGRATVAENGDFVCVARATLLFRHSMHGSVTSFLKLNIIRKYLMKNKFETLAFTPFNCLHC
jgi:hypothetical protein